MSFPYYDQVERAYRELVAEGKIKHREQQEEVEQDKGLLTRRAGYYANIVDHSIGILTKTSGNNSQGYSVDIVIHKDGTFWDIATDSGGMAKPVNGGPANGPDLIPRWAQPTAALAGIDGDVDPPPGPVDPPPDSELEARVVKLEDVALLHQSRLNDLQAMVSSQTDQIRSLTARVGKLESIQANPLKVVGKTEATWGHQHIVNLEVSQG